VRAGEVIDDLLDALLGRGGADIGPRAGAEPSVTLTPSWILRRWLCCSACASVLATTNSTPSSCFSIMLLTALPPAPPTPNTVIRGFSSP
jgi:hypothetical protein